MAGRRGIAMACLMVVLALATVANTHYIESPKDLAFNLNKIIRQTQAWRHDNVEAYGSETDGKRKLWEVASEKMLATHERTVQKVRPTGRQQLFQLAASGIEAYREDLQRTAESLMNFFNENHPLRQLPNHPGFIIWDEIQSVMTQSTKSIGLQLSRLITNNQSLSAEVMDKVVMDTIKAVNEIDKVEPGKKKTGKTSVRIETAMEKFREDMSLSLDNFVTDYVTFFGRLPNMSVQSNEKVRAALVETEHERLAAIKIFEEAEKTVSELLVDWEAVTEPAEDNPTGSGREEEAPVTASATATATATATVRATVMPTVRATVTPAVTIKKKEEKKKKKLIEKRPRIIKHWRRWKLAKMERDFDKKGRELEKMEARLEREKKETLTRELGQEPSFERGTAEEEKDFGTVVQIMIDNASNVVEDEDIDMDMLRKCAGEAAYSAKFAISEDRAPAPVKSTKNFKQRMLLKKESFEFEYKRSKYPFAHFKAPESTETVNKKMKAYKERMEITDQEIVKATTDWLVDVTDSFDRNEEVLKKLCEETLAFVEKTREFAGISLAWAKQCQERNELVPEDDRMVFIMKELIKHKEKFGSFVRNDAKKMELGKIMQVNTERQEKFNETSQKALDEFKDFLFGMTHDWIEFVYQTYLKKAGAVSDSEDM